MASATDLIAPLTLPNVPITDFSMSPKPVMTLFMPLKPFLMPFPIPRRMAERVISRMASIDQASLKAFTSLINESAVPSTNPKMASPTALTPLPIALMPFPIAVRADSSQPTNVETPCSRVVAAPEAVLRTPVLNSLILSSMFLRNSAKASDAFLIIDWIPSNLNSSPKSSLGT